MSDIKLSLNITEFNAIILKQIKESELLEKRQVLKQQANAISSNYQLIQRIERKKSQIRKVRAKVLEKQLLLKQNREKATSLSQLFLRKRTAIQDASSNLSQKADMAAMDISSNFDKDLLEQIYSRQRAERARCVRDLLDIYPILPNWGSSGEAMLYSIRGLLVPNSEWPFGWDLEKVATALSYAAMLTSLLASYLDVPLRYPIYFLGTRTTIYDFLDTRWNPTPPTVVEHYVAHKDVTLLGSNEFPLFQLPSFQMFTDWWARFRNSAKVSAVKSSQTLKSSLGSLRAAPQSPATEEARGSSELVPSRPLSRGQYLAQKVRERRLAGSSTATSIKSSTSNSQLSSSFRAGSTAISEGASTRLSPADSPPRNSPAYPLPKPLPKHSQLDYGVFYLNKNIEQLCDTVNVQVVHLRNTLPNLLACMQQVIHLSK